MGYFESYSVLFFYSISFFVGSPTLRFLLTMSSCCATETTTARRKRTISLVRKRKPSVSSKVKVAVAKGQSLFAAKRRALKSLPTMPRARLMHAHFLKDRRALCVVKRYIWLGDSEKSISRLLRLHPIIESSREKPADV